MSKQWEHREGQFTLFDNTRKEPNSKQPDMRGEGMFGGTICELSAWKKTGRNGEFLSLVLKEKRRVEPGSLPYADRPERPVEREQTVPIHKQEEQDDVPF